MYQIAAFVDAQLTVYPARKTMWPITPIRRSNPLATFTDRAQKWIKPTRQVGIGKPMLVFFRSSLFRPVSIYFPGQEIFPRKGMLIETATFMWQFLRVQKPAQATNPKIVVAVRNANHDSCGHFIATIIPEPNRRRKKSRWKRRMQAAAQRAVAGSVRFAEWDGGKQTVHRAARQSWRADAAEGEVG